MDVSDEDKGNDTSSFTGSDSGHDDDEFDTALAEQERGLEPDHCQTSAPNLTGGMDEEPSLGPALHLRGGAEAGLQKIPFVVKFRKGQAGAVYS